MENDIKTNIENAKQNMVTDLVACTAQTMNEGVTENDKLKHIKTEQQLIDIVTKMENDEERSKEAKAQRKFNNDIKKKELEQEDAKIKQEDEKIQISKTNAETERMKAETENQRVKNDREKFIAEQKAKAREQRLNFATTFVNVLGKCFEIVLIGGTAYILVTTSIKAELDGKIILPKFVQGIVNGLGANIIKYLVI